MAYRTVDKCLENQHLFVSLILCRFHENLSLILYYLENAYDILGYIVTFSYNFQLDFTLACTSKMTGHIVILMMLKMGCNSLN